MTTAPPPHPAWTVIAEELADGLLDLPNDALIDLLVRDVALTATWLPPSRVLLELSGVPPRHGPALRTRGWSPGRAGCWHRPCGSPAPQPVPDVGLRTSAARAAAAEAVGALRDVLQADPADVLPWRPAASEAPPAEGCGQATPCSAHP